MVNWFINNSGGPHTETLCILNLKCEVKSDINLHTGRCCGFFSGYEKKRFSKRMFYRGTFGEVILIKGIFLKL